MLDAVWRHRLSATGTCEACALFTGLMHFFGVAGCFCDEPFCQSSAVRLYLLGINRQRDHNERKGEQLFSHEEGFE